MPDYEKDGFGTKQRIKYLLQGIVLLMVLSYMFYRSVAAFVIMLPALYFYMKIQKKKYLEKQKELLGIQFKELLQSLLQGMQAGYSIENAFLNAYQDMKFLYGENAMISRELVHIRKGLCNNRNLEDLLNDFARRSHQPDICDFADVFRASKRSGGNLPDMMKTTAGIITSKVEVKRRIATVISAKKMEQSIMQMVPFGILLYIDASSPGFFDVLYHNPAGVLIMTVLLGIYLSGCILAGKIMQIEM